jgi:hypothetical protein
MAMAAQRKSEHRARVTEDGKLEIIDVQLKPGTEYDIELVEVDDDAEFARLVAYQTLDSWINDPEEDAAWSYLQKEV